LPHEHIRQNGAARGIDHFPAFGDAGGPRIQAQRGQCTMTSQGAYSPRLEERSSAALSNHHLRHAVRFTVERLRNAKTRGTEAFGKWEEWRELGRAIRSHTIEHLDYYLAQFSENACAQGAEIHFAGDAEEARKIL